MTSPRLEVQKFRLYYKNEFTSTDKFRPGLNIIYGGGTTGKSTVLRLIKYCLGGSYPNLPPEVLNNYDRIVIQVLIQDKIVTIERDLHSDVSPIKIYYGDITRVGTLPDIESHRTGTASLQAISPVLLNLLDIPQLRVPVAPKNPDGRMTTVSTKDMMKILHLDDDVIGTNNFMEHNHPLKFIKFVESLKALLKVDSGELHQLAQEATEWKNKRLALEQSIKATQQFLDKNNLAKDELESELRKVANTTTELRTQEEALSADIGEATNTTREMTDRLLSVKEIIGENEEEIHILRLKLTNFKELLKAYDAEIDEKEALKEYPALVETTEKNCPTCNTLLPPEPTLDLNGLNQQIAELDKKKSDLTNIVERIERSIWKLQGNVKSKTEELTIMEQQLNIQQDSNISALLRSRDKIMLELGQQLERERSIRKYISMVSALDDDAAALKRIQRNEELAVQKVENLKKQLRLADEVSKKLSKYFAEFIDFVHLTSAEHPLVKADFIPYITSDSIELNYFKTTSVSQKAVLCVGYLTAILKYALVEGAFLPSLLLIDSPSSGRSNNKDNPVEEIDAEILEKIYEYWLQLTSEYPQLQIIVVDSKKPINQLARDRIIEIFDKSQKESKRTGLAQRNLRQSRQVAELATAHSSTHATEI